MQGNWSLKIIQFLIQNNPVFQEVTEIRGFLKWLITGKVDLNFLINISN